ncbi:MAG: hypothetical protein KME22_15775 [Hassallia sp. WJT32-NPBG1]|nr:hypothetical protein [Hassallia sp. WJT32-NPBG1]
MNFVEQAIAALCYKGELPSIIAYNQFLRPDVRSHQRWRFATRSHAHLCACHACGIITPFIKERKSQVHQYPQFLTP